MKTMIAKPTEVEHKWYVVDLKDVILGRAAVKIADRLRGKDKPIFSPHMDCGDNIIVINARHVAVTGNKAEDKKYYRYTGFPGGLRKRTYSEMMTKFPERVIEHAVRGMIPHNRLGRKVFKKLHVYADGSHPHNAQKPEKLKLF